VKILPIVLQIVVMFYFEVSYQYPTVIKKPARTLAFLLNDFDVQI